MKIIYTEHALHRMFQRNISKQKIEETITFPTIQYKKYNKRYYTKKFPEGKIEIVTELKGNIIKIITVYWL